MADKAKDNDIGEVILTNVRLSFADIYAPSKERKDPKTEETIKGQYKCNLLISKSTDHGKAMAAKVRAARDAVIKAKWGANPPKLKPEKIFFRDGDLENWDGYADHLYVSANRPISQGAPVLVTRQKDDKGHWKPSPPGQMYSGCFVNAIVRAWVQDNEHGIRVNCSIESLQYFGKGAAFGAAPVDTSKFSDDFEQDEDDVSGNLGDEEQDALI